MTVSVSRPVRQRPVFHALAVRARTLPDTVGPGMRLLVCGLNPSIHAAIAAISGLNVKMAGSHAGVSIGEDGPSQMALEDLAMMRAQPNVVVLYPCDAVSTERLLERAAYHRGPVYMRTSRPKTPVLYGPEEKFAIGGSKVLRQSPDDVAMVVAAGRWRERLVREAVARVSIARRRRRCVTAAEELLVGRPGVRPARGAGVIAVTGRRRPRVEVAVGGEDLPLQR